MNYRKALALGLSIGLIASGILIASLAVVSRSEAEPVLTSFYGGTDGYCGQITSSGEQYDCSGYTAASGAFPMGTWLRVCYLDCVVVRVNDVCACPVDLSMAAANAIGLPGADITDIEIL